MTELPGAPDGYVEVLPGIPREEALVVQGLLDSNGIRTVLVGARAGLHVYTREVAHILSVHVPAEQADEARAMLAGGAGEPFDVPDEAGGETDDATP